MRVKTRWHKTGPKPMKQLATVAAATIWRVAHQAVKNMLKADFEIERGPRYLAVMAEFMVFLVHVADRMAYERLKEDERVEFTTAAAVRLAEILEQNQLELFGPNSAPGYRDAFIELVNRRGDDYATCGYSAEGPDYGFLRVLAHGVRDLMEQRDRTWVFDQVMEIEAPEAVKTLQKALRGLFNPEESDAPHPVSSRE
ncbi:MAG: hypothetical protein HYU77_03465 [Betaproteobacteria bacterium]|nr:hypothetical protein [Betaproteobacteria bacterium]